VIAQVMCGNGGTTPAGTTEPIQTTAPSAPSTPTEPAAATVPADGNPDDVTCQGSYSVTDEEMTAAASTVVATMGDAKLTNAELQVYYWMQVYDFLGQYGSYASMFGLDVSKPLDTQLSLEGTMTWQQYFLDAALDTWVNYQAMSHEAEANSFVLDEEYEIYLEELPIDLADSAASMGFENADKMVQADMGIGADMNSYMSYLNTYYTCYMYYGDTLEKMAVTDADVEAYFDAHAAEYQENGLEKNDERYVNVRHILITPEGGDAATEEQWAAAEQKANEVMNEWLSKHNDEDGFSVMAQVHSQDPGSASNGGLYENVYKGQMVEPFENWCFDESRQPGDTGLVKTSYGYHVMYFVKRTPIWEATSRNELRTQYASGLVKKANEDYPITVDYSAIVLGHVEISTWFEV
jgi:hypothetical protein